MEDSLSVKSNESIATSEEFDFVVSGTETGNNKATSTATSSSQTPTLDIKNGDFNELQNALTEVLTESDAATGVPTSSASASRDNNNDDAAAAVVGDGIVVGQSTFYTSRLVDVPMPGNNVGDLLLASPTEKQDSMKVAASSTDDDDDDDDADDEVSDVDQDCTIFAGVTYLGAAAINAPKSEGEIQRNMAILNEQSVEQGIKVSVSVPCSSHGFVVLYDANTNSVISRYEIHRILFYARGGIDTAEAGCFAFTWSHGDTQESAIFQCHVFRCDIAEAVSRVSACFAKAFQRVPRSMSSSVTSGTVDNNMMTDGTKSTGPNHQSLPEAPRTLLYVFEVNLEIKEDDGKGTFTNVGKDKHGFKLKSNLEKQLCLNIRQVSDNGPQLFIERCFGVLIAAGRYVRHSDMQLLEMEQQQIAQTANNNNTSSMSLSATSLTSTSTTTTTTTALPERNNSTIITAIWDPTESAFEQLNNETAKDTKQFMTVAVDLVIRGIQEPVRFQIETPVRVYGQIERNFWYFQKKSLVQQFFLNLNEIVTNDLSDVYYEVLSMESSGELLLDRNLLNLNLLTSLIQSPSITSIDTSLTPTKDDEYHSDGDEPLLSGTGLVSKDCAEDVLENWADVLMRWKTTKQRPKQLTSLVRLGIPEALRGEVWQRLACFDDENTDMMENYRLLITKESSCENVIQRDIARTFPAHDFFKKAGGLGQDSLYRVSKAYAVYDSEVGYCQGLSFLAATLLLHMPEEQAFCVLVKLMYNYGLRDFYKDGFDNLYLRLYQLNRLMEEQLGTLWQHFTSHHIETHMFASQWFLTLFTARFPLYFVFHIIDVFLLQGIDTLFQVALALLMLCKKDLLQLDFEGILKYFRVSLPKKCRTEESAKQLIKLACNIKVKKLKKYEMDFISSKETAAANCDRAAATTITDHKHDINEETSTKNELNQLRLTLQRYDEERKLLLDEITQLKEILKREVNQSENETKNNLLIINDYKSIRQTLDARLCDVENELDDIKMKISNCDNCCSIILTKNNDKSLIKTTTIKNSSIIMNDDDDDNDLKLNRIRELELELAQTKLAHVEAECRNQDLTHQLRATELELNTAKNSWPPWLSKTLTSIKEVANNNKKDFTSHHFPYPPQSINNITTTTTTTPSFISHINNSVRRDSVPLKKKNDPYISSNDSGGRGGSRRESAPIIIKDSQSCSSLKTQN